MKLRVRKFLRTKNCHIVRLISRHHLAQQKSLWNSTWVENVSPKRITKSWHCQIFCSVEMSNLDYLRVIGEYSHDESLPVYHEQGTMVECRKKSRRIEEEFPEIVVEIERILLLNGYAAHKERHIDHSQFFGTSMSVLVEHLLATFPLLAKSHPKLAPTTLAHLFVPPNEASPSAPQVQEYPPRSSLSAAKRRFCVFSKNSLLSCPSPHPLWAVLLLLRVDLLVWQQTQSVYWCFCCE